MHSRWYDLNLLVDLCSRSLLSQAETMQVKYCSESNKRLIHFSTCEVYGKTIGCFLPKDHPLKKVYPRPPFRAAFFDSAPQTRNEWFYFLRNASWDLLDE